MGDFPSAFSLAPVTLRVTSGGSNRRNSHLLRTQSPAEVNRERMRLPCPCSDSCRLNSPVLLDLGSEQWAEQALDLVNRTAACPVGLRHRMTVSRLGTSNARGTLILS